MMEPWQSWAAALAVGGGLFYYYTKDTNAAAKINRAVQGTEQPQLSTARRRQDKQPSHNKSVASKVAEKTKEAVDNTTEAASSALSSAVNQPKQKKNLKENAKAVAFTPQAAEEDEGDGDLEWAQQLEARKKGISLSAPSSIYKPSKQKQPKSKAQPEAASNGGSSRDDVTSSNANQSDHDSTQMSSSAPVGGDVSDMLEARGPAPSVLRIVGEEKPKKQQAPKAEVVTETKKQRQNRRKVEEQRSVREDQEKERQALLEKQRRTAREARGEPAKNGLAPSKAPSSSAWSASGEATSLQPSSQANGVSLLDTFDHDNGSNASSNEASTNGTASVTGPSTAQRDYPVQEAQPEQANEASGWAEVSNPKKGKKKVQPQVEEPVAPQIKSDFVPPIPRGTVRRDVQPAPAQKAKQQAASNGFAALEEPTTSTAPVKGHPDDSEWL